MLFRCFARGKPVSIGYKKFKKNNSLPDSGPPPRREEDLPYILPIYSPRSDRMLTTEHHLDEERTAITFLNFSHPQKMGFPRTKLRNGTRVVEKQGGAVDGGAMQWSK